MMMMMIAINRVFNYILESLRTMLTKAKTNHNYLMQKQLVGKKSTKLTTCLQSSSVKCCEKKPYSSFVDNVINKIAITVETFPIFVSF